MKNLINFVNKIYTVVKNWVIANDVEGILGLVVGIITLILGYNVAAGVCFGIFGTKNYEIFKAWAASKVKRVGNISNLID